MCLVLREPRVHLVVLLVSFVILLYLSLDLNLSIQKVSEAGDAYHKSSLLRLSVYLAEPVKLPEQHGNVTPTEFNKKYAIATRSPQLLIDSAKEIVGNESPRKNSVAEVWEAVRPYPFRTICKMFYINVNESDSRGRYMKDLYYRNNNDITRYQAMAPEQIFDIFEKFEYVPRPENPEDLYRLVRKLYHDTPQTVSLTGNFVLMLKKARSFVESRGCILAMEDDVQDLSCIFNARFCGDEFIAEANEKYPLWSTIRYRYHHGCPKISMERKAVLDYFYRRLSPANGTNLLIPRLQRYSKTVYGAAATVFSQRGIDELVAGLTSRKNPSRLTCGGVGSCGFDEIGFRYVKNPLLSEPRLMFHRFASRSTGIHSISWKNESKPRAHYGDSMEYFNSLWGTQRIHDVKAHHKGVQNEVKQNDKICGIKIVKRYSNPYLWD